METIKIPVDSDGFTSLTCPDCTRLFKTRTASPNPAKPATICPYCAHRENEMAGFVGPQLREYIRVQGANAAIEQFKKMGLKGSAKPSPLPPAPAEPASTNMASLRVACCGFELRHDGKNAELHCPSCGTKQPA
jgi:hypothetical protein